MKRGEDGVWRQSGADVPLGAPAAFIDDSQPDESHRSGCGAPVDPEFDARYERRFDFRMSPAPKKRKASAVRP